MSYEYCLSSMEILSPSELEIGWKKSCIKKMFRGKDLPTLDLSEESFNEMANKNVLNGKTVAGVQKKLSLNLSSGKKKARLSLTDLPCEYILKPQAELPFFPESENLVMTMADRCGIQTVMHGLIKMKDSSLSYITKRIDRDEGKKIAMEDFCQLSFHLSEDKYLGSYESLKEVIAKYSSRAKIDLTEYFYRLVFSFLTLNSDMHRKNFSLIKQGEGYVLSPAYDLLPVNLVFPMDKEECALTLNGKKKGIRRKDFLAFSSSGEIKERIPEKVANALIDRLLGYEEEFLILIERSLLNEGYKKEMARLMKERFTRLG